MPDFTTIPAYGKPLENRPAQTPRGVPILQNWKDQKSLVSVTNKMMKAGIKGKGKKGPVLSGKMKLPKPGKKHKVRFY